MSITDSEYLAWLTDQRSERALLVEIEYKDNVSEQTAYMATRAYVSHPGDTISNQDYPAIIKSVPVFSGRRGSGLNWGSIDIVNNGDLDVWLEYAFDNRSVTIALGDPSWSRDDFRELELKTTKQGLIAPDKSTLRLFFYDASGDLDKPVQSSLLDDGKPIPLCYGDCFNITPAFLGEDASGAHYQVHDGSVDSITVRSGGASVAGVTTDVTNGKFSINPAPTSGITCDVVNSTYSTAAEIIEEIITGPLGISAARINSTSFAAFREYGLGVYVKDRVNAAQLIDGIAASAGGYFDADIAGLFFLWTDDIPDASDAADAEIDYRGFIQEDGFSLAAVSPAISKIRIQYQKNYTHQDASGLFTSVSTANRDLYSGNGQFEELDQTIDYSGALEYPEPSESYIVSSLDASSEASRKLAQFAIPQKEFQVVSYYDPAVITLGDVIKITHPRFGFSVGVNARIIGIEWTPTQRMCKYTVVANGAFCDEYEALQDLYSLDTGKPYCQNDINTENILSIIL